MDKKQLRRFGFTLDQETAKKFLAVCDATRISQSKHGREAVEDLIKKYEHLLNEPEDIK